MGHTLVGVCDDTGEDIACHNSMCHLGLCSSGAAERGAGGGWGAFALAQPRLLMPPAGAARPETRACPMALPMRCHSLRTTRHAQLCSTAARAPATESACPLPLPRLPRSVRPPFVPQRNVHSPPGRLLTARLPGNLAEHARLGALWAPLPAGLLCGSPPDVVAAMLGLARGALPPPPSAL